MAYPNVASYDTQLQRMWYIGSPSMYFYNLPLRTRSTMGNQFNIVTLTYDPVSRLFYGLAQAAQSALVYYWAWDYPSNLYMLGVVPNVQVVQYGTTCVDPTGSSLAFITSLGQIVTVNLTDASVISISAPLTYQLSTWAFFT